jgi:hypothetical protein
MALPLAFQFAPVATLEIKWPVPCPALSANPRRETNTGSGSEFFRSDPRDLAFSPFSRQNAGICLMHLLQFPLGKYQLHC